MLSVLVLLCFTGSSFADEIGGRLVPAELQVALFTKILTFDRNLAERCGDTVDIVVLYHKDYADSRRTALDFAAALSGSKVQRIDGHPVTVSVIAVTDQHDLARSLVNREVDFAYIAQVRALDVKNLIRVVEARNSATLTPIRAHVENGAAVGIELRDGKPHVVVNLRAARTQGMDLSAQLLKLAEVIER